MKKYISKIQEGLTNNGTIKTTSSDCNNIPEIKKIILNEYSKISKKQATNLKAWSNISHKYDLLPEDADYQNSEIKKSIPGSGSIIWDTVSVSYSFEDHLLYLDFNGYKLNKEVKVRY